MMSDEGVALLEKDVRSLFNIFSTTKGVEGDDIAQALNQIAQKHNVNKSFDGGMLMADDVDGYFPVFMKMTETKGSFMANLNSHWVIVDKFDASKNLVKIRDPWNNNIPDDQFKVFEFGREAEISADKFINAWKNTQGGVVWPR
jgi:hypothetical protein